MNDDRPADNRVFETGDGDIVDRYLVMRFALVIRLNVPQITGVPVLGGGQPVLMAFRVIVAASAHAIRSRAVPVLMNMEGMFLARIQPFEIRDHFDRLAILREANHPMALLASSRVQHRHRLLGSGIFSRKRMNGQADDRYDNDRKKIFHKGYHTGTY